MKISGTTGTFPITLEELDFHGQLIDVEATVEYRISDYYSGDYYTPPEGGDVECVTVTVRKVTWTYQPPYFEPIPGVNPCDFKAIAKQIEDSGIVTDADVFEAVEKREEAALADRGEPCGQLFPDDDCPF